MFYELLNSGRGGGLRLQLPLLVPLPTVPSVYRLHLGLASLFTLATFRIKTTLAPALCNCFHPNTAAMASIYLVNALYNNSGVPAASTMQGVTQVKREVTEHHQPTAEIATATEATKPATAVGTAELATATAIGTTGPLIEAKQVETQAEQHEQQSGAGDAMHPARQLMVEFLGLSLAPRSTAPADCT
jgi:hypothetical protein